MTRNPNRELQFKDWMRTHRGILVRISRSFSRNPADISDLEQEMMLQLWNSLPAYSGQSKDSTWVYRVCLNTALMWRRGEERRGDRIQLDADISEIAESAASPAEDAGQVDLLNRLYDAIHGMPDLDRTLVLMTLDDLSYREISEVLGLTENHVGVALTRAKKRLVEVMKGVTNELG
jgi:RNA polymerase sigma-70 factor (ECF subfamily)